MITKDKWVEIIKDFHEKALPDLIERNLNIPLESPIKRAVSIIGPRRAGKTYAMYQVIKSLLKNGFEVTQTVYINFEKTDMEGCDNKDMTTMIQTFYEIYPENRKKKVWLFLDEIQNVKNWEKFVREAVDDGIQVFISGSSSKLLSKEIATSLRGRTISYTMLPFSFSEYLLAEKIENKKYFSSSEKSRILNSLKKYMENGGYPEAVLYSKEREKILIDILETTIYRDVIERHKIRNIKLLKLLIKALINSAEREFSVHKFYNFIKSTGMKASKNALYNYLDALNDVFFVFPIRKFSYSYKEVEQSLPKICVVDNGILSANGINDNGRLMENIVFIELLRRGKSIHYYKSVNNNEVDFTILENSKPKQLLQVAFSVDDLITKERKVKSLLKASKELKCNNLTIITWDKEDLEKAQGKKIIYIPLWKWLLS